MDLTTRLQDCSFVAFDTETSGAYPIGFDIVEFGAVKWFKGEEVGRLQFLFSPREPMSDFIIGIHGITNEMVRNAPPVRAVLQELSDFVGDAPVLGHNVRFDLSFLQRQKVLLDNDVAAGLDALNHAIDEGADPGAGPSGRSRDPKHTSARPLRP